MNGYYRIFWRYRRLIALVVIFISIITILTALLTCRGEREVSREIIPSVRVAQKPLNTLLTNKMSDFDGADVLDRDIEWFMRRWELVGGSFALMHNDSLIYAKGYGFADREKEIKCDVNHLFRMASASKLITATAVSKLIEQNKLSLSSKAFGKDGILSDSIFLNYNDRNIERITVEHLLCHTSGLQTPIRDPAFSNYTVAQSLGKSLPLCVDDLVVYATHYRLRYAPGGKYRYSNLGYLILGRIIEQVSGMSYEDYVRDSLFAPIGCNDIYIGRNFSKNRPYNEVEYYEVKEATAVEAYDGSGRMTMKSNGGNNVTLLSAAGGWVASPVELLRFVAAIDGCDGKKDILSKKSIDLMAHNGLGNRPMGWASIRGNEWIRSGSMAGTSAIIKRQSDGYSWIFIANSSPWIGYLLTDKMSYHITRAIKKVKKWPKRDLFEIGNGGTQINNTNQ